MEDFVSQYLSESARILEKLDRTAIEAVAGILEDTRRQEGRLFFIGVGGSAANCSHAVNDVRKLAGIEAYCATDNVSELTARVNDEGWPGVFASWLKVSRLGPGDTLFIMSVGGGDEERNISPNLVEAIRHARQVGSRIVGVVGRDGGYVGRHADACVIVPVVEESRITPHTEAFQSVICHLLVSHPRLKTAETKWESAIGHPS